MGILCMKGERHLQAAGFFAKAHDFVMLAHEEEGLRLTLDCLDCEKREDDWWVREGSEGGENSSSFKASKVRAKEGKTWREGCESGR